MSSTPEILRRVPGAYRLHSLSTTRKREARAAAEAIDAHSGTCRHQISHLHPPSIATVKLALLWPRLPQDLYMICVLPTLSSHISFLTADRLYRAYSSPMDAVEKANVERQKRWIKDQKVGEGTYAVVYRGLSRSYSRTTLRTDIGCEKVERRGPAERSLSRKSKWACSRMD